MRFNEFLMNSIKIQMKHRFTVYRQHLKYDFKIICNYYFKIL